ncbi:MAG: AraC family transcriptional regulator [Clostridia bacterium]|nr:AraC family transcriptional regulator [Clostridia bacterium]
MAYSKYELHQYDSEFPIMFRLSTRTPSRPFSPHWHEHIEILYIKTGICRVDAGGVISILNPGDVILFSPDCPHDIRQYEMDCSYYCITVDRSFCVRFGIPVNRGQFSLCYTSGIPCDCFARIVSLMEAKPPCYREEVKALCMQMLAVIYRDEDTGEAQTNNVSNEMVARAIEYINTHFAEPVTVDEISEHVGFSKFYFCRKFKTVTGKTVVDYINMMRCINAKRLIKSGQYNVSESAFMSGFHNLSYFSKTYIKHMGNSPSEEK